MGAKNLTWSDLVVMATMSSFGAGSATGDGKRCARARAPCRNREWSDFFFQSGMTNVMSAPPGDPLDAVSIIWLHDIVEFDGEPKGLITALDKIFD